ncbi:MAG TPA: hypothetical protein VGP26_21870 [Actinophytocola sp.]|jgi:hypothetical protein|nr:hypothetical protein [Actinophytocola sp.]
MNTPNYPPPAGPPQGGGQYGPPPGYGPPGGRPPGTPPGGQQYGPPGGRPPGTPPGGQQYGPPGGRPPQTPPGGQPYGQPGQYGPGPGGPPPGTPPGGQSFGPPPPPPGADAGVPPAPAPKKRNRKANLIRIGILVVIAIGVAAFALIFNKDAPASAKAGDCIKVNDVASANIETIDCKSADAMYKVGVTKDDPNADCPSDNYLAYTETGGASDVRLCMVLIAKEGQCFKQDGKIQVKIDCTKGAEFKIAKVIEGSDDAKGCGAGNEATAVTYPEPKLTLCLTAPDAAAAG